MKITFIIGRKQILTLAIILFIFLTTTSIFLFSQKEKQNQTQHSKSQPQVLSTQTTATQSPNTQSVKVVRVIDGDTIELETGQKVRYIGVDTPETVHPNKSIQCFGIEASNKNKELVEGKSVRLEKDVSETDKYGRLLRYVYLNNTFINKYLVEEGYAYASTYPPDAKHQEVFKAAQQQAQSGEKGLWSNCSRFESTSQSISSPTPVSDQSACSIKGNISSSGEKIYHMPGRNFYDKTVIDESKGERWFCSEQEAISSGWRKSKT